MTTGRPIALWLALLWIGVWTLGPAPGVQSPPFWCVRCTQDWGLGLLLNTLLFAPLGAAAAGRDGSVRRPLVLGLCVSLVIELVQWRVLPGRGAAFADLVANTLGSGIGAWCWRATRGGGERSADPWLAIGAVAVVLGLPTVARRSLEPYPSGRQWFGQPAPNLAGFVPYGGALRTAVLDGAPLVPGPLAATGEHRGRLRALQSELRVSVDRASAETASSLIAQVADEDEESQITLGEDRLGYWATVRTRAAGLGFRSPVVRVPRGGAAGRQQLEVRFDGPRLELQLHHAGGSERSVVPLGLTAVWQAVTPTRRFAYWNREIGHLIAFGLAALVAGLVPGLSSAWWPVIVGVAAVAGSVSAGEPWSVVFAYCAGGFAGAVGRRLWRRPRVTRPAR